MTTLTTPATERAHHPFSPSTLQFLEACPCYKGRGGSNERAIAGTLAHGIVETKDDDFRLSDDDAANAAECLDFFEARKRLFCEARDRCEQKARAETSSPADRVYVPEVVELTEVYLPIDDCEVGGVKATTAGYVDKVLITHDRDYAEMFDWKFGAWPVEEADNNLQGFAYTLGLWKLYPAIRKVRFIFTQPMLNNVSTAVFEKKDVAEMYRRIQTVVERARTARQSNDFSMAHPVVPACNFCANIGTCPHVCAMACKIGAKFHPIQIPENITPTQVMDPNQATLGLRLSAVMKTWAEAFRQVITDRVLGLESPVPPGYKIQERADREIVDSGKFRDVALKHVTQADLDKATSYTFGPVEDAIKEKTPRGAKKAMVEAFQQECLSSGAVKKGDPYYFLRAVAQGDDKTETK